MNPKKSSSTDNLIDMQEAIALLKTTRPTFYRWLRTGKIQGMKIGRQWRFYLKDIEQFLRGEVPRIDLPADIKPFIALIRHKLKEASVKVRQEEETPELVEATRLLLLLAVTNRASDIHIEPQFADDLGAPVVHVRFRIDGVLHTIAKIDKRLLPPIIGEFKRMVECDLNVKDRPQDGRAIIKLGDLVDEKQEDNGKTIDLRMSFLMTGLGEMMTARLLNPASQLIKLDFIDYSPRQREIINRHLKDPWGMIVVSGPTGSGKTTNLYAFMNELCGPELKSVSIEDPIEYFLPWVNQVAVNVSAGVSFSAILNAVMNSDPDIIMIGELVDSETLHGATQAAMSGHLVLTQLHVNDTSEAIRRMIDIGKSDTFVLAETLRLVTSQRLVRKLCTACSVKEKLSRDNEKKVRDLIESGGLKWNELDNNFRKPAGCDACNGYGYHRRNVITEVLDITPVIASAIRDDLTAVEIKRIAISEGMVSLVADGIMKASRGETSIDEVLRATGTILSTGTMQSIGNR